jgi:hypothetical protein
VKTTNTSENGLETLIVNSLIEEAEYELITEDTAG